MKCFTLIATLLLSVSLYGKSPSLPTSILHVPILSQATSYSCGASALHSLLLYWKVFDGPEVKLHERLHTTAKDGTHPLNIVKVAQQFGLDAEMKEKLTIEMLKTFIQSGHTVIIDIQAWPDPNLKAPIPWASLWEDGHYVVVIGMDNDYLYVMDPSARTGYGYIPLNELISRWHDYEDENGKIWRNYQLGIIIHGKSHIKDGELVRIE